MGREIDVPSVEDGAIESFGVCPHAVGARIDHFVRREDHVRTETILNAKLDALAVALTKMTEGKP